MYYYKKSWGNIKGIIIILSDLISFYKQIVNIYYFDSTYFKLLQIYYFVLISVICTKMNNYS